MTSRYLADEAQTLAFAAAAAHALPPATGTPLIVHLEGELGAGKTSFARGMVQALGERGAVRSPTYALMAEYELACGPVIHADLYRLADPSELEQLGLRDRLADSRLWLIEWPERGRGFLPPADVVLRLAVSGSGRQLVGVAHSEAGRQWLAAFPAGPVS